MFKLKRGIRCLQKQWKKLWIWIEILVCCSIYINLRLNLNKINALLIALGFTRTVEEFSRLLHRVAPLEDSSRFIRLVRIWRFPLVVWLPRGFLRGTTYLEVFSSNATYEGLILSCILSTFFDTYFLRLIWYLILVDTLTFRSLANGLDW